MVLVDERFLDNIYRKEPWKQTSDDRAKSLLNHELKSDLDDSDIPDDIKAKQHQIHLNRFLHTSRQLPIVEAAKEDLVVDHPVEPEPEKKKPKKKIKITIRKSKRKVKNIKWEPL